MTTNWSISSPVPTSWKPTWTTRISSAPCRAATRPARWYRSPSSSRAPRPWKPLPFWRKTRSAVAEDFLEAINSSDFDNYDVIAPLATVTGKYYKLEGYLFPDTYDFYKGEEIVGSVVGKLVYNFQNKVESLMEDIQASGMTLDQIVTLASIIQREAANTQDMYNVSAVLHNRLDFGAQAGIYRLECDSTIYYPYHTAEDVPADGALPYGNYNTYEIQGLPAGAICQPRPGCPGCSGASQHGRRCAQLPVFLPRCRRHGLLRYQC